MLELEKRNKNRKYIYIDIESDQLNVKKIKQKID
jgi:hypothetical protein